MPEHYQNLRALRGIACLLVLSFHVWCLEAQFGLETMIFREIHSFGFAGVDLFFVLSGFVIISANRHYFGQPRAVPGYLFRRFWRLYPTYWIVMIISATSGWAIFDWPLFTGEWLNYWPGWMSLAPIAETNRIIGPAWTLTFEVTFYFAIGILLLLPSPLLFFVLCGWAATVLAATQLPEPRSAIGKVLLSPFVLEFLGGCVVAWLACRGHRRGWRYALILGFGYALIGSFF